jgi:hypothetical protein
VEQARFGEFLEGVFCFDESLWVSHAIVARLWPGFVTVVWLPCDAMAFSVCLLPSASEELRKLWEDKEVGKLSDDFFAVPCQKLLAEVG